MNRRAGRELALQMLFAGSFWKDEIHHAGKNVLTTSSVDPEVADFAKSLFDGTIENLVAIDDIISKKLDNWKLGRLHLVDRAIIRLAVFELLYPKETPASVIIDQAVRLGKKFGGDESGRFINGILGGIYREFIKKDETENNS